MVVCDGNLATKWYRFSAAAGEVMPDSCVPTWRCGTHAPGWLNGKHPTEAEGVVSRQVCYHWISKCCNWKNNIRVRNCGGFYVYELTKPPACHLRYCGGANAGSFIAIRYDTILKLYLNTVTKHQSLKTFIKVVYQ